ncbi:hypothetical protein BFL28_00910 [Sphingomonas turrisvirgatae]|uniref:Uncharacterized protein n=1 Tax=Sphingomonas turrisvirgatae TaxID=1888892 RepID=A0A1E3LY46_9SPHN|nr:hypothetical protein BFL28_00910 [Sphingomonas turrisvirgatae]
MPVGELIAGRLHSLLTASDQGDKRQSTAARAGGADPVVAHGDPSTPRAGLRRGLCRAAMLE